MSPNPQLYQYPSYIQELPAFGLVQKEVCKVAKYKPRPGVKGKATERAAGKGGKGMAYQE